MNEAALPSRSNAPLIPEPQTIRDYLQESHTDLLRRRDELLAAAARVPAVIEDAETEGRVGDFVKMLLACIKESETRRIGAKSPALAAGKAVDGFFQPITDRLEKAKGTMTQRLTVWQRQKAEEERQRREAEARAAREAEEKAKREAEERAAKMETEGDLQEAVTAETAAQQASAEATAAAEAAAAKPADLSRARGDLGSVSSLRTFWTFRDLDRAALDLEALRAHLPVDALEKAIRSFVKAGGRTLRGVTIFEDTQTVVH